MTKQAYTKPQIEQVKLVPTEAVLGGCTHSVLRKTDTSEVALGSYCNNTCPTIGT
ncbi:MAG: hypothetical protein KKA73_10975 [Chloroflexi bacterium]|nr:hypothetical protein [Chloroflexota bacterium]MBU1748199.1 hypothetical protein [Chloroflexota bacterium]